MTISEFLADMKKRILKREDNKIIKCSGAIKKQNREIGQMKEFVQKLRRVVKKKQNIREDY